MARGARVRAFSDGLKRELDGVRMTIRQLEAELADKRKEIIERRAQQA